MFFNKIKFNYNTKLLDDLFVNKNYDDALETIIKNKKNKELFKLLLNYLNNKYLLDFSHAQFYKKKLFWIVSYDQDENIFLNNFFKNYFEKLNKNKFFIVDYKNFINIGLNNLIYDSNEKNVSFEQIIQNSNLFQTSSMLNIEQDNIIISTSSAFFETPNKRYFIHPNSTKSYVYVIRNPFQLYLRYKSITNNSLDSLNRLNQTNYDNSIQSSESPFKVSENKQNWSINVGSWNDENVKDTFRGKIIKFEDLRESTYDSLVEILFHFKQSGLDVDLDYELINNYVNSNIVENDYENNLSRQESKMVINGLNKSLLSEFEYQV